MSIEKADPHLHSSNNPNINLNHKNCFICLLSIVKKDILGHLRTENVIWKIISILACFSHSICLCLY